MRDSRFPDFFIIGAPKCGTTALYHYLSEHPEVHMSSPKEPHFFSRDLPLSRIVRTAEEYAALFSEAPTDAVTGEGSTWYLFSEVAVPEILSLRPDARFVVILRNPVHAVQSLHAQMFIGSSEDLFDFESAWRAQEDRAHGNRLPAKVLDPIRLQYGHVCSYASQVERLLRTVPEKRVKIFVYEEFFANPEKHFHDLQVFLGITPRPRTHFQRVNERKRPSNLYLHKLLKDPPALLRPVHRTARKFSQRYGLHLGRRVAQLVQSRHKNWPKVSAALEHELYDYFSHNVSELEMILGRSLHIWRQRP